MLLSCSQDKSAENASASDTLNAKEVINVKEIELAGLYADHQVRSCTDNEKITATGSLLAKLDSAYKSLLPQAYPGQTIYVRVKGLFNESAKAIEVKQVIQTEQKNDKNTCVPYEYWCMGNEPFWRVQISEKENLIDFFDPMAATYYHFNYAQPEIKQGSTVYTADLGKDKIKVTVTSAKCSDGMSEREYQYKAEVVLNGKVFNGCAVSSAQNK